MEDVLFDSTQTVCEQELGRYLAIADVVRISLHV